MKRIFVILLSLTAIFVPLTVLAVDTTTSFSISPVILEAKLKPGESKTFQLTVFNKLADPQIIQIYTQNFEAANEIGDLKFTDESNESYAAKDWFTLETSQVVLEPMKSRKVNLTLRIPAKAEQGGHYVAIFFESVNAPSANTDSGVNIAGRIGALAFITVDGQIVEEGRVLGASTSEKCEGVQCSFRTDLFREWGPVPFEFKFENTGNIHVKVRGKIEIYNLFHQKIGEVPVDEKTVLPGNTRNFEAKWLREPLFGRYSAKLTINYGSSNSEDHAQIVFWVFPWKIILPFVILILIGLLIFIKKKSFKFRLNKNGFLKTKKERKPLDNEID